jgi:hypothetical protein
MQALQGMRFSTVPVLWGYPQMLLGEVYTVAALDLAEDVLRVQCAERGAVLTVWAPRELEMRDYGLRVADAQRVRWAYEQVGRADAPPMSYFVEMWRTEVDIAGKSNSHWDARTVGALVDKTKAAVLWPWHSEE